MDNNDILLKIEDLTIHYETRNASIHAVNNVSLTIRKGETLGLVGETGAGKTTTALGIMNLLPIPPGKIVSGRILFDGQDVLQMPDSKIRKIRGNQISMIFQDPMTALNPIMRVADQIAEVIHLHQGVSHAESLEQAAKTLEMVGIPASRGSDYPHQFSGGMKQRVVIAMALACSPRLLLADEPTTALDVTIQAQVLDMMKDLKNKLGSSMLMITHDLGIVAETCDNIAVMYAGEIVEYGSLEQIFDNTSHPYTKGLFGSLPQVGKRVRRLHSIAGLMPDPANLPAGCKFHPRCPMATQKCAREVPPTVEIEPGHFHKCWLTEDKGGKLHE